MEQIDPRLREVSLSLRRPSCVTRKKTARKKNGRANTPPFFPRDVNTVTLDGLSERGTARSLHST